MRYFKMFATDEQKKEIEDRFTQFLRMFRSVTDNVQIRDLGRDTSKILMLKSAIQPLDNSTDVFMMIVFTMYGLRSRTILANILSMADSIHTGTQLKLSGESSTDILDGIEDVCVFTIQAMERELRITPDDVSHEPMELLMDFKVQVETMRYQLESNEV